MQNTIADQSTPEQPAASPAAPLVPNFDRPAKDIAEFVNLPEFPQNTLGEFVEIRGYAGVVIEIVKQSLKVKSPDGITMSYNMHGLKKIYGKSAPPPEPPPSEPAPAAAPAISSFTQTATPWSKPATVITEPNFDQPIKAMRVFAGRRDFPDCALGEYVDIRGYAGVVVSIVDATLEVKAPDGNTRSYGAVGLRKLFS